MKENVQGIQAKIITLKVRLKAKFFIFTFGPNLAIQCGYIFTLHLNTSLHFPFMEPIGQLPIIQTFICFFN